MIHYHGTPVGGTKQSAIQFLAGRHALVPYTYQDDIGAVMDVCQSFCLDNGAFTIWKRGGDIGDYFSDYVKWVNGLCMHPGFDFALIPDVIDGTAEENDEYIEAWKATAPSWAGVPVWHLHEPIARLAALSHQFRTVALGSSGAYAMPGTKQWWKRMSEAMRGVCTSDGKPTCRLHGLRMLDPQIFSRLPLSSADSTNAAVNSGSLSRFGIYLPPNSGQRATVIADRIEAHNSAPIWHEEHSQEEFEL